MLLRENELFCTSALWIGAVLFLQGGDVFSKGGDLFGDVLGGYAVGQRQGGRLAFQFFHSGVFYCQLFLQGREFRTSMVCGAIFPVVIVL